MKIKNIRGLSPVIASVLMIMLVLFLAALIFLWSRGFISEQIEKMGKPIDDYCADVNIAVHKDLEGKLKVVNHGDIDVFSLDFKFTRNGNSETRNYDVAVNAGGDGIETEITLKMEDGSEPDEIVIYPVLLGNVVGEDNNKKFTCIDYGVTID